MICLEGQYHTPKDYLTCIRSLQYKRRQRRAAATACQGVTKWAGAVASAEYFAPGRVDQVCNIIIQQVRGHLVTGHK